MDQWTSAEDPEAAADANDVEAILTTVASLREVTKPVRDRPSANHALWLCACDTLDDGYLWLIYDNDDRLFWCRIPGGFNLDDLVVAQQIAGTHGSPGGVLHWLEGAAADLALGDVYGDTAVVEELGRKIRGW